MLTSQGTVWLQAAESMEEEREAAIVCKRRLSHLQEYDGLTDDEQQLWKKKRLDRMLVEYCLRLGYYDTALKLSTHSNIKVPQHQILSKLYTSVFNAKYIHE